ncbi:MAG: winged helix-turn-helix domain-containing protein [Candidatus Micrarchaeota archaeon]
MDEDVVVSRQMLRAMGAETRTKMLKALRERQKTQSELAAELGISAPTVLEHVGQLQKAGLIELVPEYAEKKWKYYRLTRTGRGIVEGRRMSVVMLLASGSAIISVGLLFLYAAMPIIISALTGSPAVTAPPSQNATIPTGCGEGACLSSALGSLQSGSQSFVGVLAMFFLLLTLALVAVLVFQRMSGKKG